MQMIFFKAADFSFLKYFSKKKKIEQFHMTNFESV